MFLVVAFFVSLSNHETDLSAWFRRCYDLLEVGSLPFLREVQSLEIYRVHLLEDLA